MGLKELLESTELAQHDRFDIVERRKNLPRADPAAADADGAATVRRHSGDPRASRAPFRKLLKFNLPPVPFSVTNTTRFVSPSSGVSAGQDLSTTFRQ